MSGSIEFLLNGEVRRVAGVAPTTTLLEHLRGPAGLPGTKEGCAEGDCGACTVIVGELRGGRVHHTALNACIQFLPMLDGKSITTVEHVAGPGGTLHPCQQAMVEAHGSQCGFCTPGFVMSLYGAYLGGARLSRPEINDLLAGNLCRCTGYGPIIAAAGAMFEAPAPAWQDARLEAEAAGLAAFDGDATLDYIHGDQRFIAPRTIAELARIYGDNPGAHILSGATDIGLWVTKQHRHLATLIYTGRVTELAMITETADALTLGAGVTYGDAHAVLARHFPDLGELVRRIGAEQVRGAGTIGGNIANGSPIGDMPPALIALDSRLILRKGAAQRDIALEDYFLEYGRQDRQPGEFVEAVRIPLSTPADQLKCYKITKRFDQDISALCGCFNITIEDGIIASARIAFGGMAAIPKRARAVEAALAGLPWNSATITAALPAFEADFTPLTDMRASAKYRLEAAKNLLVRAFEETRLDLAATRLAGRGAAS